MKPARAQAPASARRAARHRPAARKHIPAAAASRRLNQAPAPAAPALTIDDVRKVVASKAAAHRDDVKAKLTELGAKNVTTLDPGKYQELVDYLNTLA